jgi:hypothetical protein
VLLNARRIKFFSATTEHRLVFSGRADYQVTCTRALSHATILFSIRIGNERLRTANVKCDATLHLKSAKRKHSVFDDRPGACDDGEHRQQSVVRSPERRSRLTNIGRGVDAP